MNEKIKNKIKSKKEDKKVLTTYLKVFTSLNHANEVFQENEMFKEIKNKDAWYKHPFNLLFHH